ncbi:gnl [Symbiodinium sp. KB8]|nr:gnl [Symbiodinium sp. KB8]
MQPQRAGESVAVAKAKSRLASGSQAPATANLQATQSQPVPRAAAEPAYEPRSGTMQAEHQVRVTPVPSAGAVLLPHMAEGPTPKGGISTPPSERDLSFAIDPGALGGPSFPAGPPLGSAPSHDLLLQLAQAKAKVKHLELQLEDCEQRWQRRFEDAKRQEDAGHARMELQCRYLEAELDRCKEVHASEMRHFQEQKRLLVQSHTTEVEDAKREERRKAQADIDKVKSDCRLEMEEQKRKHERSVSILKQQSDVEAFRTEHCVGDVIAVKSRSVRERQLEAREKNARELEAQLSRQGKEVEEQRRRLPLPQHPANPGLRSVAALHPEEDDSTAMAADRERLQAEHQRLLDLQQSVRDADRNNKEAMKHAWAQVEEERRTLQEQQLRLDSELNARREELDVQEHRLKAETERLKSLHQQIEVARQSAARRIRDTESTVANERRCLMNDLEVFEERRRLHAQEALKLETDRKAFQEEKEQLESDLQSMGLMAHEVERRSEEIRALHDQAAEARAELQLLRGQLQEERTAQGSEMERLKTMHSLVEQQRLQLLQTENQLRLRGIEDVDLQLTAQVASTSAAFPVAEALPDPVRAGEPEMLKAGVAGPLSKKRLPATPCRAGGRPTGGFGFEVRSQLQRLRQENGAMQTYLTQSAAFLQQAQGAAAPAPARRALSLGTTSQASQCPAVAKRPGFVSMVPQNGYRLLTLALLAEVSSTIACPSEGVPMRGFGSLRLKKDLKHCLSIISSQHVLSRRALDAPGFPYRPRRMAQCGVECCLRLASGAILLLVVCLIGILFSLGSTEDAWHLGSVEEVWNDVAGLDLSAYFLALLIGILTVLPALICPRGASEKEPAKPEPTGKAPGVATPAPPATPAPKPKPKPKPKPLSPRSQAKELVGSRMSPEQAQKAAEKIISLRSYVERADPINLDEMWAFFDMPAPTSSRSMDPSDPVMQTLKGKLNRQRLLFHPDKNGHPEAEKTFKFLEVCHQKLMRAYTRQGESVHQRTRREEEELKKEEERRKKQEEERRAQMALIEKEEEERVRRAEMEKQRLEAMLQAKQLAFEAKCNSNSQILTRSSSTELPVAGIFAKTCVLSKSLLGRQEDVEQPAAPIGTLKVQLLRARDLPTPEYFLSGFNFAEVRVGEQSFQSPKAPGENPVWDCSFSYQVHRVDTVLGVSIFREGWFQDYVLGKLEIPFLDLEEWSGHPIGRLLEPPDDADADADADGMLVELRASFEWF